MNDNIIVLNSAFSLDFCNELRRVQAERAGTVGEERVDLSVRKSNIRFFDGYLKYPKIYEPLCQCMSAVNEQHFKFDIYDLESPQLTEYDESYQGEYKPHVDSTPVGADGLVRKLSMTIQLTPSENYEGGELIFPNADNYRPEITKEQGTAIIFPSYLNHGVTPVTKGNRKSLVAWARGPQFA